MGAGLYHVAGSAGAWADAPYGLVSFCFRSPQFGVRATLCGRLKHAETTAKRGIGGASCPAPWD